jgi:hypothetical protein
MLILYRIIFLIVYFDIAKVEGHENLKCRIADKHHEKTEINLFLVQNQQCCGIVVGKHRHCF